MITLTNTTYCSLSNQVLIYMDELINYLALLTNAIYKRMHISFAEVLLLL